MTLEKLKADLAKAARWTYASKADAHAAGNCIKCGENADAHCHSPIGKREYQISGLCEDCWDAIFAEGEE